MKAHARALLLALAVCLLGGCSAYRVHYNGSREHKACPQAYNVSHSDLSPQAQRIGVSEFIGAYTDPAQAAAVGRSYGANAVVVQIVDAGAGFVNVPVAHTTPGGYQTTRHQFSGGGYVYGQGGSGRHYTMSGTGTSTTYVQPQTYWSSQVVAVQRYHHRAEFYRDPGLPGLAPVVTPDNALESLTTPSNTYPVASELNAEEAAAKRGDP
jgi:hypothetical protein